MNLVTGASGILGSFVLAELVKQGKPVWPCKQTSSSLEGTRQVFEYYFSDKGKRFDALQWRELDLQNLGSIEEALREVKVVYHCAAMVSFKNSERNKLFRVNVQGTANLLNLCLQVQNLVFCHVSSIATLNNSESKAPLNEEVFWKSTGKESDYGISKYSAEREVWRAVEEGLKAVIVNPGLILAPAFWEQSSANVIHLAYKGNRFCTGGQVAVVMAKDVARVMIQLVQGEYFGRRFIVVENNYSYSHFLGTLRKGFGYRGQLFELPKSLMNWVSLLERFFSFFIGRDPRFTPAIVRSLYNMQTYSNKTIQQTLHYSFTPLEEGVPELCQLYRKALSEAAQAAKAQPLKMGIGI